MNGPKDSYLQTQPGQGAGQERTTGGTNRVSDLQPAACNADDNTILRLCVCLPFARCINWPRCPCHGPLFLNNFSPPLLLLLLPAFICCSNPSFLNSSQILPVPCLSSLPSSIPYTIPRSLRFCLFLFLSRSLSSFSTDLTIFIHSTNNSRLIPAHCTSPLLR